VPVLRLVKNLLKPVAKAAAKVAVWTVLFVNFYIFKSSKNHLPILLANLCFNDSFVFKLDPKLLKYHISDPDSMPENLFIWSGEWDRDIITIEEHEKFIMIKELFVDKKDYQDTQFYSLAVSQMLKGDPVERGNITLDSTENINLYFEKHKKILKDIKTNGFDLGLAPQIGVVVDRDGHFIHFRQGHHTLAMAKILGVENVIVRIRAIHSLWLCHQIKSQGLFLISSLRKGFKKLFK